MSWWGGNSIPAPIVYDELPTPITDEDYKKVARDALADSLALEDDPGWSQLKFNDPNVQLYELNDPDSAIKYVKISTELPASPKEIYQFVTDDRMEQRLLWDKELIEIRVIKKVEDIDVIYQAYKAPYPVTNRNFVAIRGHTTLEDGTEISYGQSINYSEILSSNDFVRGTALSAMIIRPVPGEKYRCKCSRIVKLDPKGSIPTMVINKGISKAGDSTTHLRKVVGELSRNWFRKDEKEEKAEKEEKKLPVIEQPKLQIQSPIIPQFLEEDKENISLNNIKGYSEDESDDLQFWDTSNVLADSSFQAIEDLIKPLQESFSKAEKKTADTSEQLRSSLKAIEDKQKELQTAIQNLTKQQNQIARNISHQNAISISYTTAFVVLSPLAAYAGYRLFNFLTKK